MGDSIDKAQEYDQIFRQNALDKHFAGRNSARSGNTPYIPATTNRECEDCGKTIPANRLKANPAARRCIECQTRKEKRGEMDI
jgi:DnaK suppressor protein